MRTIHSCYRVMSLMCCVIVIGMVGLSKTVAQGSTPSANEDATAAVALSLNPVENNTDWTPYFQTFDGYEMALVPVGCFTMGSDDAELGAEPAHEQCFNEPFWIDRYEVTNKQYGSEGDYKGDNHPREVITWFEARDFCFGRDARLPTEREWEYAARGPSNWVYPWGNNFMPDNLVWGGGPGQTLDVGSQPGGNSWVGASDMSGNLMEWVSTIFGVDTNGDHKVAGSEKKFSYPYVATDGREEDSEDKTFVRILRGGSWNSPAFFQNPIIRAYYAPFLVTDQVGFRCVRSTPLVVGTQSTIEPGRETTPNSPPANPTREVADQPVSISCPGLLASRLVVGQHARVTPGNANNLRANPSATARRIGQIPAGAVFEVLSGPQCVAGYAWWEVNYNGQVGWTAEADSKEYWTEPIPSDNESQTQQLTPTLGQTNNPNIETVVQEQPLEPLIMAQIAGLEPTLPLRTSPTMKGTVIRNLARAAVVTIISGPEVSRGETKLRVDFTWWKVRTEDGVEGWVTESAFGEPTLIRMSPSNPLQPVVCTLTTLRSVNIRSGPSTQYKQIASRTANQLLAADGQFSASDGTWWHILDGFWIRADSVSRKGNCDTLPMIDAP